MRLHLPILALSLAIASYPDVARAQWVHDGVALCAAPNYQINHAMVSDGAGGAIMVWEDWRSGSGDIYAQRVNASGVPLWTTDGVAVCSVVGNQLAPKIASDGVGGAIVTWQDSRGGVEVDIFAQRVDAAGAPEWFADGVKVCAAVNDQQFPRITSDGFEGAIVTWRDWRSGDPDPYAQRMSEHGERLWTENGIALCIDPEFQWNAVAVSDGTGGAIVAWEDYRSGPDSDIYAQRLNASGTPKWETNGVAICAAAESQHFPVIVPDGGDGAIVTWEDGRSGVASDIYAQRINDFGEPQWMPDGVAICTADWNQQDAKIIPDGVGGAIVSWQDNRIGPGLENYNIYAQRVNASGAPQWEPDGVALCMAAELQYLPSITSDGAEGAIVTWVDHRSSPYPDNPDIAAQRVNAAGNPAWMPDGVALCTAPFLQRDPEIVSDGVGGAIVGWQDSRSDPAGDIYAQRVLPEGGIPTSVGDTRTPSLFALSPNFPNPFSVATTFDLSLDAAGAVEVEVFDAAGRRVRVVDLGRVDAGSKRMSFDGRDESGQLLPSGVYFYRVHANGATHTRKMVIVR